MDLTFNIIYTRGTVRYLRLLVFSLLKWSESSFRLVANACSPEEVRLLQELCYKNSRLEFLALPSERGMQHSEVLSYLQALERLDHFCFMDSDIIATGDFVNEMLPYLDNHAAVFSAPPLWCTEEEQILPDTFPVMGGRFNRTSSGLCIGSTHFAMYDNRVLSQSIQSTGIDFKRYRWEEIPARYQAQLIHMGLKKSRYDTGKLLNVLLAAQGTLLLFVDSSFLHHIGGFSVRTKAQSGLVRKVRLKSRTWRPAVKLKRWIKRLIPTRESVQQPLAATQTERVASRADRRKRVPTAFYFNLLFKSLFENRPLPAIPNMREPEIERRIKALSADVVALYEEFGELFT